MRSGKTGKLTHLTDESVLLDATLAYLFIMVRTNDKLATAQGA
ncbi:hypothetical protein ABIB90_008512 [Bradyrhizobium sp. JR4.1]